MGRPGWRWLRRRGRLAGGGRNARSDLQSLELKPVRFMPLVCNQSLIRGAGAQLKNWLGGDPTERRTIALKALGLA